MVNAPWLRQFAELHDFALIGTSFWGNLSGMEINIWDSHLQALASASEHPELVHAPWAPMGFSNGGQMSYGFNALRPEKTIAFIANKGCCYNTTSPSLVSPNRRRPARSPILRIRSPLAVSSASAGVCEGKVTRLKSISVPLARL